MKIYISGAITGHDNREVTKKFAKAQKELECQGHEVLNPLENGLDWKYVKENLLK